MQEPSSLRSRELASLPELDDLVAYLTRGERLSRAQAARLIDEVLAFLNETAEQFICRRHRELQREGCVNAEIFERIGAELLRRRFRAAPLTPRQIRRIVYG